MVVLWGCALFPSFASAVVGGMDRAVFCVHGFSPTRYETFSFEPLEGEAAHNGFTDAQWAPVRDALASAMEARGYRHVETGGQLLLSYGAFPPVDRVHPVTGLFLKFRTGTGMLDLTKWSAGAMDDLPYTAESLVRLAGEVSRRVPARDPKDASAPAGVPTDDAFLPATMKDVPSAGAYHP
ncbi:MAG TPA: DUF4136 domain-containing protein [Candidatus Methylacidiphilales bacterium]